MKIGDRIANRRKQLGMTQTELAYKMGYKSKAAISKIETNVNDITQSTIVKFAEALDTSVSYLMGWEDDLKSLAEETVQRNEIIEVFDSLPPELRTRALDLIKELARLSKSQDDRGGSD